MKTPKVLSIAAVAAMALLAFTASSASATALYNGTTKLSLNSTSDFSVPSGGSTLFVDTSGNTLDKCTSSTLRTILLNADGAVDTLAIEEFTWGNCTFATKTLDTGFLEVLWSSGTTGTVRVSLAIKVTINTVLFGSCVYEFTSGKQLGTLTTSSSGAATFDANAVAIRSGTNSACPTTSKWTGSYTQTLPNSPVTNLRVESS